MSRLREFFGSMFGSGTPEYSTVSQRKVRRWLEYEYRQPGSTDEHEGHDVVWTAAPGVWHCRTCVEWYRTWHTVPNRHPDQRG